MRADRRDQLEIGLIALVDVDLPPLFHRLFLLEERNEFLIHAPYTFLDGRRMRRPPTQKHLDRRLCSATLSSMLSWQLPGGRPTGPFNFSRFNVFSSPWRST
jgi:hypothetical protein